MSGQVIAVLTQRLLDELAAVPIRPKFRPGSPLPTRSPSSKPWTAPPKFAPIRGAHHPSGCATPTTTTWPRSPTRPEQPSSLETATCSMPALTRPRSRPANCSTPSLSPGQRVRTTPAELENPFRRFPCSTLLVDETRRPAFSRIVVMRRLVSVFPTPGAPPLTIRAGTCVPWIEPFRPAARASGRSAHVALRNPATLVSPPDRAALRQHTQRAARLADRTVDPPRSHRRREPQPPGRHGGGRPRLSAGSRCWSWVDRADPNGGRPWPSGSPSPRKPRTDEADTRQDLRRVTRPRALRRRPRSPPGRGRAPSRSWTPGRSRPRRPTTPPVARRTPPSSPPPWCGNWASTARVVSSTWAVAPGRSPSPWPRSSRK